MPAQIDLVMGNIKRNTWQRVYLIVTDSNNFQQTQKCTNHANTKHSMNKEDPSAGMDPLYSSAEADKGKICGIDLETETGCYSKHPMKDPHVVAFFQSLGTTPKGIS